MKVDSLTKNQKIAIAHNDGDLIVSASAGSGKTMVMINRIIRLVKEKKATVKQILAMTFTESAAAEMKEKLVQALTEEYSQTGDKSLLKEIGNVAVADISTVHSFCSRLIRNYFFISGVSPDYSVADDKSALEYKSEAVNAVIKDMYERKDAEELKVASRYSRKRSDKSLKKFIISVYSFFSEEAYPEKAMEDSLFYYTLDGYKKALLDHKELVDNMVLKVKKNAEEMLFDAEENGYSDSTINFANAIIERCENIISAPDVYALKAFAEKIPLSSIKNASPLEKALRESLQEYRERLIKTCENLQKNLTDDKTERANLPALYKHAEAFIRLVKDFKTKYDKIKREENQLDFSDLQHYAIKTLLDPVVRKEVQEKYKYVLIDEYQDTNATQEEIINLVSNNNLFMVGDEKQSIYGFRGCRPEFFHEKFKKLNLVNRAVSLNENFRSAKAITEATNEVFDYCMTLDGYGLDYKNTARLNQGGVYPPQMSGRFCIHHYPKDNKREKETPRVYNILDELSNVEDDNTISLLTNIIREEIGQKYYDFKAKEEKIISYKDIAVLSRKKTEKYLLPIIKGVKARGIPVTSGAEENIIDYPEIKYLIGALQLIDCMQNDVALATVMKSPVGNFSNEDLARISFFYKDMKGKTEGFYNSVIYYKDFGEGNLKQKVIDFLNYFEKLRFVADFLSAKEVLFRVIEENDIEANLLATNAGESKVQRVKRLLSFAGEGKTELTVKSFIRKLEDTDKIELTTSGENEDAVKFITVHSSKGLEYPVVILCDGDEPFNIQDVRQEIFLERKYGFICKYYDDEERISYSNYLRELVKLKFADNRNKEEMRLFYVAMTRAKYSLHIIYSGKAERDKRFVCASKTIDYVPPYMAETDVFEEDLTLENSKRERTKVIIGQMNKTETERIKKNLEYVYPFLLDTVVPIKTSVTKANETEEPFAVVNIFDETEEIENFKKESRELAIKKGNIAHKFMEHYDFNGDIDFNSQAENVVKNQILKREDLALIDLDKLKKAVSLDVLKGLKGKTLYREKDFILSIPANLVLETKSTESVLVQGIIDLLIIDNNDAYIVDYKYSKSSKEHLVERYKKQLNLYAFAVEKILGKKVKGKTLINLYSGEMVEID